MTLPAPEPVAALATLPIRAATPADAVAIAAIIVPVIRAGETYALARDLSESHCVDFWMGGDRRAYVAIQDDRVVGTYYLRANQAGGGSHVANCGYMTAPGCYGRGVARRMGQHSLSEARTLGYRAIQFNFVVSTNLRAVRIWQSLGFVMAGRLPGAFQHPTRGWVDVLVMYQSLP